MHTSATNELYARWLTQARKGWLEFFLLLVLSGGRSYGYEIATRLREATGADLAEGTLYPLLKRLERDGLVAAQWDTETGTTPRKYYAITSGGAALLARMRDEWAAWNESVEQLGTKE